LEKELEVDEEEPDFEMITNKKWGLLGLVYSLCNDDMLKVDNILESNLFEFFNFVSYKIDMNNLAIWKQNENPNS